VKKLTLEEIREEPVGRLVPDPAGPYPAGLHTVGSIGNGTLIDGARWAFIPAEMKRALARKLGRSSKRS
jgi:hypothetical protein